MSGSRKGLKRMWGDNMKKAELRAIAIREIDKYLDLFKNDKDLPFDRFEFEFFCEI